MATSTIIVIGKNDDVCAFERLGVLGQPFLVRRCLCGIGGVVCCIQPEGYEHENVLLTFNYLDSSSGNTRLSQLAQSEHDPPSSIQVPQPLPLSIWIRATLTECLPREADHLIE